MLNVVLIAIAVILIIKIINTVYVNHILSKYGTILLAIFYKLTTSIGVSCMANPNKVQIAKLMYVRLDGIKTDCAAYAAVTLLDTMDEYIHSRMARLFILTEDDMNKFKSGAEISEAKLIENKVIRFEIDQKTRLIDIYIGDNKLDTRNNEELKIIIGLLKSFNKLLYLPSSMKSGFVDCVAIDYTNFELAIQMQQIMGDEEHE